MQRLQRLVIGPQRCQRAFSSVQVVDSSDGWKGFLSSKDSSPRVAYFTASWCGPCRAENPNVVKAFQKFQSKNFHILGVSLDRAGQKDKWMKAIHDDGLTWTQVSDLKFWNNTVAVQYGIRAIPQNLLLDPNGIIVGKNLRGEKLMSTLEGMLK